MPKKTEFQKWYALVYVRYRDHVLFRSSDARLHKPAVRETVGWLEKESEEAIWITWDRSVESLPYERVPPEESGLIILKANIMELRKVA